MREALFFALVGLAAAGDSGSAAWYDSSSVGLLEKALAIRGIPCQQCSLVELQKKAKEHATDPVDPEHQAMYAEDVRYRRLVRNLNMTKDEVRESPRPVAWHTRARHDKKRHSCMPSLPLKPALIIAPPVCWRLRECSQLLGQMNASEGYSLGAAQAERVWAAFQMQLESGGVVFQENGTLHFAMPFTHRLAPFLPAALCDTFETTFLAARRAYLDRVPRKVRRRLATRLDYAADSGLLLGVIVVLVALLLFDIAGYHKEQAEGEKEKRA